MRTCALEEKTTAKFAVWLEDEAWGTTSAEDERRQLREAEAVRGVWSTFQTQYFTHPNSKEFVDASRKQVEA